MRAETEVPSIWTLPTWLEAGSPQLVRLVRWLLGPRFVDLPIRVLVLHAGVTGFVPSSAESSEFSYFLLQYASCCLTVAAAFVPRSAAVVSLGLFLVFVALYPELLNPFDTPVGIAAAVLLSAGRWRWWLLLLTLLVGAYGVLVGVEPEQAHVFAWGQFFWVQNALLALAAFFLEARMRREIELRRDSAAQHEREVLRMRLGVAADAHDTIAHGLAAQDAIIRLLVVEGDREAAARMLRELALVTGRAQAELRDLLDGLRGPKARNTSGVMGREELLQEVGGLCSVAGVAGLEVAMSVGDLPPTLPAREAEQARYAMRELVTNIVKHSAAGAECAVGIGSTEEAGRRWLVLESRNPVEARGRGEAPRTLMERAEGLGGCCSAVCADGEYRVTVKLPIREEHRSNEGRESAREKSSLDG